MAHTGRWKDHKGYRKSGWIALAACSAMLGGCISYTNVPDPDNAPAFENANHYQSVRVTAAALEAVIAEHPARGPDGRFAINLPAETTRESAMEILGRLPDGAIVPYEAMEPEVPVYHITRIWIRATEAKVDVIYPLHDLRGNRLQGNVTVWLHGGITGWSPSRMQYWTPGTLQAPPLHIPLTEADLAVIQAEEARLQALSEAQGQAESQGDAEDEAQDEEQDETDTDYQSVPVED